MVQKQKYQAYAAATQTVAKTQQIVMLYDGVIRFVQQAKDAIRKKNIEERYHLLVRATKILSGLQACLDFEQGGDVAKVLFIFYSNVNSRIFTIHRTNSLKACDEVIADLKHMRDVWHEIDQKNTSSGSSTPTDPTPPATDPDINVTLSA